MSVHPVGLTETLPSTSTPQPRAQALGWLQPLGPVDTQRPGLRDWDNMQTKSMAYTIMTTLE
ncbi:unnamed protein product [Protopolystoma xenopodis]|uniref:Uncharacterized protein n=1 Tax=Protopolystoma xenopodis TaxID=117903 RepID=A0A448XRF0_9PLAT|nr:unnamed protein product [Protopolystoma xenopodis]